MFFGLIRRATAIVLVAPVRPRLESRIKEICQTRVRYGYRRVHFMLRREGWVINEKKTRRVYNEMGMQLRSKTPKRRVKAALRADRTPPSRSNEVWAMDFVHDQLATGTKLRILDCDRYLLALCTGRRSASRLSRCRCRGDAGTSMQGDGLSGASSASIRAANSSPAIWTCGRTRTTSRSTSHGLASRPTTLSSRHSTVDCARNA